MADKKVKTVSLSPAPQEEPKVETHHPTLRHARLEDIPALLQLGEKLFKDSPMEPMEFNPEKVRAQLEKAIISDQKDFLVLVSHVEDKPVGILAAYAFTPIFTDHRIACEVFWYLEPEYRKGTRGLDMMRAYEYWAKLVGCKVAQYGWLVSSPKNMPVLYERTGAELAEQVYYKVL